MEIYKMMKWEKAEGLFSSWSSDSKYVWYALLPDVDSINVKTEEEIKKYDVVYAMKCETDKMPLDKVLEILLEKLYVHEVKKVLETDKLLEKAFMQYLSNPFCNKKI